MQKDNSTLRQKIALRQAVLREIEAPVLMETHGGYGRIFTRCYRGIDAGCVLEKDSNKAKFLAQQRPTWAVYEGDAAALLSIGAGAHLRINLLDVDPYGDPFPTIHAFLMSQRPPVDSLWIVVNDGLRQKTKMGGAWSVETLKPAVAEFGNDLYPCYLDVCRWLLHKEAEQAQANLLRFSGYYCGYQKQMTHYAAMLSPA